MNIREQARKYGGEAMVAKLDKGFERERRIADRLLKLQSEEITLIDSDEALDLEDRLFALTAICEAQSKAYAVAVATLVKMTDGERGDAMVTSIRSFSSKLTKLFESDDAKSAGVDKLIAAAATKGALNKGE